MDLKEVVILSLKIHEYLLYCRENELAKNTIKNYQNTLKQLDEWCSMKHVDQLNKESLIEYKLYLKEECDYKLSTINQKIVAINIYLNWAESTDLKVKQFKQQMVSHRESINQKEYKRLLKHTNEELNLFILTIANTGLRISELCALSKDDLDKKVISIENKGKTRSIAIPVFVKKQLKKFMAYKGKDEPIFSKTQSWYRQELKAAASKAKVDKTKVYPHSLRHYFAKQFIENGGDSTELQQMLGHSSIKTTTIYTHLDPNELSVKFRQIHNV